MTHINFHLSICCCFPCLCFFAYIVPFFALRFELLMPYDTSQSYAILFKCLFDTLDCDIYLSVSSFESTVRNTCDSLARFIVSGTLCCTVLLISTSVVLLCCKCVLTCCTQQFCAITLLLRNVRRPVAQVSYTISRHRRLLGFGASVRIVRGFFPCDLLLLV